MSSNMCNTDHSANSNSNSNSSNSSSIINAITRLPNKHVAQCEQHMMFLADEASGIRTEKQVRERG